MITIAQLEKRIEKLEAEREDKPAPEKTYGVGERFIWEQDDLGYLLALVGDSKVQLICEDGIFWDDPSVVGDSNRISEEEWEGISKGEFKRITI